MSALLLTTAKWPTRLPSNSKCVNRNSVLSVPQSISRPQDRKILFLDSVCMLMCMCLCVCAITSCCMLRGALKAAGMKKI